MAKPLTQQCCHPAPWHAPIQEVCNSQALAHENMRATLGSQTMC